MGEWNGIHTRSCALIVFPNEMPHLLRDTEICTPAIVWYPSGRVMENCFEARVGIMTETGKECLPWLQEMAICLGNGDVRLSGHTLQENCLFTMDLANQVLHATTLRWSVPFSWLSTGTKLRNSESCRGLGKNTCEMYQQENLRSVGMPGCLRCQCPEARDVARYVRQAILIRVSVVYRVLPQVSEWCQRCTRHLLASPEHVCCFSRAGRCTCDYCAESRCSPGSKRWPPSSKTRS